MTSFLRGKQAGMQRDLSASIQPSSFTPGEQARYGINSQISCLAYDPVQSLLAVGTNESKYGNGMIYVFGQARIQKVFTSTRRNTSIRYVRFCGGGQRLVSVDSKSELVVWDLDVSATKLASHVLPGGVTCMETDPMLDWVLVGMSGGDVLAFDLDRERMCQSFKIGHLWREREVAMGRGRGGAGGIASGGGVISLRLHPRDIGQLLIGYAAGAVVYSFKANKAVKWFEYVLPPGAPGGGGMTGEHGDVVRRPKVVDALWHPSGTFVLTAHDDGSLVFWDPKAGAERVVMARSLYETYVDQPAGSPGVMRVMRPIVKIAWCCKENSEDTGVLIAGGQSAEAEPGLTFLELGQTPIYATSSWQVLGDHFKGKRTHLLPTPAGAEVTDFCLLPRLSPHFAGAQDPLAVMTAFNSGELLTLSFPSGYPISPTNQLHPSLTMVSPMVSKMAISTLGRDRWLGMTEKRAQGELLLNGGAEMPKPKRRYEGRNIVQMAHADSIVRLWDLGHADEIENSTMLQIDIARALGRADDVQISAMHMASGTGEFAAGTKTGEVVVYRWMGNKFYGQDVQQDLPSNPGGLTIISSRAEPSLKDGLQPYVLYEMMQGPISALCVSDVGFVAVGSEGGFFSIIDLRGPTVLYQASILEITKSEKKSFRRSSLGGSGSSSEKDYPTSIAFGIMTLEGDNYSSIACFVGTAQGKVATFKLLPAGSGYTVKLAGVVSMSDKVLALCPIVAETGQPAVATGQVAASLREGVQVHGVLVAVSQTEIRVFKPATSKGASKTFDDVLCDAASITEFELHGFALVGVFSDLTARAYSLPGLKEISKSPLPTLDPTRSTSAIVAPTGDIIGWTGPSELVVMPVWGTGKGKGEVNSDDELFNPQAMIPPRPTISGLQWISGTQYISPLDLDLLIGGPDRPPSKRMMAAAAEEARIARQTNNTSSLGTTSRTGRAGVAGTSQEGWGEYLSRNITERTEKLNIMGDHMDELNQNSQGWADDVGKFMAKQKRGLVLGGLKSAFL